MSISTEWELNNINRLAKLERKASQLDIELSCLYDDIAHLKSCMSKEDIDKAIKLACEDEV